MFNKLELNNRITGLKVEVQKARGQVIQKLIKRIASLKPKAEKDPKFNSKIDIIAKEINILKVN